MRLADLEQLLKGHELGLHLSANPWDYYRADLSQYLPERGIVRHYVRIGGTLEEAVREALAAVDLEPPA